MYTNLIQFIVWNGVILLPPLQWNGKTCNKDEKFKAVQFLQTLKSERNGKPKVESLDERDIGPTHKFYATLKDENEEEADEEEVCVNHGRWLLSNITFFICRTTPTL